MMLGRWCFRALVFGGCLVMLSGCATSGLSALPPTQRAKAQSVEAYLDGLMALSGQFAQTGPGDSESGGRFLYRPGHLSLDYTTPKPMHLTAGDGHIVMTDASTGAVTRVALARNPLGLLLRNPVRFNDGIQATSVQEGPSTLQISLAAADNPSQGRLTLQFMRDGKRMTMAGIDGVDARGHHIMLRLFDVQATR